MHRKHREVGSCFSKLSGCRECPASTFGNLSLHMGRSVPETICTAGPTPKLLFSFGSHPAHIKHGHVGSRCIPSADHMYYLFYHCSCDAQIHVTRSVFLVPDRYRTGSIPGSNWDRSRTSVTATAMQTDKLILPLSHDWGTQSSPDSHCAVVN